MVSSYQRIRSLFERYYPGLVRFLYRRLGDRDRAEDLAQEAFVRLLDHSPSEPRAWLYVVATNLAHDATRADLRHLRRLQLLSTEPPAVVATPEEVVIRAEAAARVQAGLAKLSDRDRTLLLLREEGLSYREIASIIGVASTSVAPLLARAQRRLVRCLAQPYAHPHARHDAATTSH